MSESRERRIYPAKQGAQTIQQYGDWLEELAAWDYWATWTYEDEYSLAACRRAIESYLEAINPAVAWWATEYGEIGGRAHQHGLLSFGGDVPQATHLWAEWKRRHGRAEVDRFDAGRGAAHYVGKYVVKEIADYDVRRANEDLFS